MSSWASLDKAKLLPVARDRADPPKKNARTVIEDAVDKGTPDRKARVKTEKAEAAKKDERAADSVPQETTQVAEEKAGEVSVPEPEQQPAAATVELPEPDPPEKNE